MCGRSYCGGQKRKLTTVTYTQGPQHLSELNDQLREGGGSEIQGDQMLFAVGDTLADIFWVFQP